MGKVVKLEVERQTVVAQGMQAGACSRSHEVSPLTPALKELIDRAIVPVLVEQYLVDVSHTPGKNQLANAEDSVALSHCRAAAIQGVQS